MSVPALDVATLRALLDAQDQALAWVDERGDVAYANAAMYRISATQEVRALSRVLRERLGADWQQRAPFAAQDVLPAECGLSASARTLPGGDLLLSLEDCGALRAVETVRDEALGFLAHDLRSPLAAIISLVEATADGSLPRSDDMPERITRLAQQALERADSVLRLMRASAAPSERFEAVDLVRVAHEAAEEVWSSARARGCRVVVNDSAGAGSESHVRGDIDLLRRALHGLLRNAVEHGPENADVMLVLEREESAWRLCVLDRGSPLALPDAQRLVARPVRREGRLRRGGGLGLSLARVVMERHGGALTVEARQGGNAFVLRLPAYRENVEA